MVILHFFYAVCQREQTVRLPELNTKVQGKKRTDQHSHLGVLAVQLPPDLDH